MEKAVLVISALLLNATLGGPRQWYAAAGLTRLSGYPAKLARDLERRLNRDHRSPQDRQWRGALLVFVDMLACIIVGMVLAGLSKHGLWLIEPLLLTLLLPVRPTWDLALEIRRGLQTGDVTWARQALEHTAWRHYALLDEPGLARAAIEILAVHFSEKILAPIFWYLLFGLPGLLVSKTIYLLHESLNPKDKAEEFGKAAQAAHYFLNYIPSRFAAVLWLAVSVFMPSNNIGEMARQMTGFATAEPQMVALQSAAAALKLTLGGPSSLYTGEWVGSGAPKPTTYDIRRALYLFSLLHLMLFVIIGFFL